MTVGTDKTDGIKISTNNFTVDFRLRLQIANQLFQLLDTMTFASVPIQMNIADSYSLALHAESADKRTSLNRPGPVSLGKFNQLFIQTQKIQLGKGNGFKLNRFDNFSLPNHGQTIIPITRLFHHKKFTFPGRTQALQQSIAYKFLI